MRAAILPAMLTSTDVTPSPVMEVKHLGASGLILRPSTFGDDGRLTRDQAERANWPRVARYFSEIDTHHEGWVTAEEIRAFNRAHHEGTVD